MEDNAELESFRRQWREEVARRTQHDRPEISQPKSSVSSALPPSRFLSTSHETSERKEGEDDDDGEEATSIDQPEITQGVGHLSLRGVDDDAIHAQAPRKEPKSALEHFERAVEKEAEGSLGASLQHYRKAYRLDSAVDKTYRNKHFASAWKKPAQAAPAPTGVPIIQQPSQDQPVDLPTPELIASFSHLPIPQAEPLIENGPQPPCPIAKVPSEVLVEILRHVALMDPASFCRMALVCKRLAYHFAHEQHIWKRLCQGSKFGFKSMHYSFACDIYGNPEYTLGPRFTPFPRDIPVPIPEPLSSWSQVFQVFPRIRFTGVYISTVNYTRPGALSSQTTTWDSPIHIVTYYRYLRFFPDGTVISILSTREPQEVVPYISKDNLIAARATSKRQQHNRQPSDLGHTLSNAVDPIPPHAMEALKDARQGRWQLTKPVTAAEGTEEDTQKQPIPDFTSLSGKAPVDSAPDPRDVVIETEGVGSKYTYTMHLSLRSSVVVSRSAKSSINPRNPAKNTKLVWKGFWSYNTLTDDWAEFGLRNDRGFVFRRVRDWGMN